MAHRALYLANESQIDHEILGILRSKCADVQVISALAQATALIESPSLASDRSGYKSLIVADVSAGGIVLAEYLDSLFGRAAPVEGPSSGSARPVVVLLDADGDVMAARKALRIGVDGYILSTDAPSAKQAVLDRLLSHTPHPASQRVSGHIHSHDTVNLDENHFSTDPAALGGVYGQETGKEVRNGSGNGIAGANHLELALGGPMTLASAVTSRGDHVESEGGSGLLSLSRLSQIESAIMSCLSAHTGLPLSARSIVHEVMGRDMDEDKAASLIRPHISRLRSKVEPTPQMPQRLLTVRGKGYMFVC